MVPAAIVILVTALACLMVWLHDRQELKRVKRDVKRALDRIERLEGLVVDVRS